MSFDDIPRWAIVRCSREGCMNMPLAAILVGGNPSSPVYVTPCADHIHEAHAETLTIVDESISGVSPRPDNHPRHGTIL